MQEREFDARALRRMRVSRAKQKARQLLREEFPGCPLYFRSVLSFMERWLPAHLAHDAWRNEDLARITYLLERAADFAVGEDATQIAERGVAMWLRANGYTLARRSHGMVVVGVRLR